jgi:hypothetical protein
VGLRREASSDEHHATFNPQSFFPAQLSSQCFHSEKKLCIKIALKLFTAQVSTLGEKVALPLKQFENDFIEENFSSSFFDPFLMCS